MVTIYDAADAAAPDLLLITYEFPFGQGETFLESELPIVASRFRRVFLFPSRLRWSRLVNKTARDVPNNVHVFCERSIPLIKLQDIVIFTRILVDAMAYVHIRFGAAGELLREVLKAAMAVRGIDELIGKFKLFPHALIAYSYWKTEAATALSYLRHMGRIGISISRAHGTDVFPRIIDPYTARYLDQIWVVSEAGKQALISNGFDAGRISVSRLGVMPAKMAASPSRDGIIRIVSCSNLIPLKRVPLLVEGLATMRVPFYWDHFGDGEERGLVESMILSHGMRDRVCFHGQIRNVEILRWYSNKPIDVFVNVSSREGVAVSIMEALAHGIPCVVTRVGGNAELVVEECGQVISANPSPAEIAQAISAVTKQPLLRIGAKHRWSVYANASNNYNGFVDNMLRLLSAQSTQPNVRLLDKSVL